MKKVLSVACALCMTTAMLTGWFGDNTFVTDMIALAIFIIASLTDLIDGKSFL